MIMWKLGLISFDMSSFFLCEFWYAIIILTNLRVGAQITSHDPLQVDYSEQKYWLKNIVDKDNNILVPEN